MLGGERWMVFFIIRLFASGGAGAGKEDLWELNPFACEVMYILEGDQVPSTW